MRKVIALYNCIGYFYYSISLRGELLNSEKEKQLFLHPTFLRMKRNLLELICDKMNF